MKHVSKTTAASVTSTDVNSTKMYDALTDSPELSDWQVCKNRIECEVLGLEDGSMGRSAYCSYRGPTPVQSLVPRSVSLLLLYKCSYRGSNTLF